MNLINPKHRLLFYLIGAGLLFLVIVQALAVRHPLRLSVLDIGQGDAILIRTPEYHNILIDAGPDGAAAERLSDELNFFEKTIDLFVLTHPHRDHFAGILDVLQKYRIKNILLTGTANHDAAYAEFLKQARDQGATLVFAQNHEDVRIGPNVYLDVLFPLDGQSLVGQEPKNPNNTSVAMRLMRRTENGWESLAMLPGDAEVEEERELLLSGQELSADILKLGHHGSKTATSEPFLAAVNPTIAIVSAGVDNSFKHPHSETMEKINNLEVRQTMGEGTVRFEW